MTTKVGNPNTFPKYKRHTYTPLENPIDGIHKTSVNPSSTYAFRDWVKAAGHNPDTIHPDDLRQMQADYLAGLSSKAPKTRTIPDTPHHVERRAFMRAKGLDPDKLTQTDDEMNVLNMEFMACCQAKVKRSGQKTMGNTDINGAKKDVKDIVVFGDGDLFKLVSKASSEEQGWMKSTKVMDTGIGCLVQVTTQQRNPDGSYALAEALTFVPGVKLQDNAAGRKVVPI